MIVNFLIHTGQSQLASFASLEYRPIGLGVIDGCMNGNNRLANFAREEMVAGQERSFTFHSELLFDLEGFALNSLTKTRRFGWEG